MAKDCGLTRADFKNPDAFFCLYFARGKCVHGKNCNFLHRIPTPKDAKRIPATKDIFGRERHQNDRDDMAGVGTFTRDCRTLYVGNLSIENVREKYDVLVRTFGEFGPIEQINVKPKFGCASVRYLYRSTPEFAREAMAEQPLDDEQQINVKWAYDDPNPRVIEAIQAEKEQRVVDALTAQQEEQAKQQQLAFQQQQQAWMYQQQQQQLHASGYAKMQAMRSRTSGMAPYAAAPASATTSSAPSIGPTWPPPSSSSSNVPNATASASAMDALLDRIGSNKK